MKKFIFSFLTLTICLFFVAQAQTETKLMSFPNPSATEITFTYAGDIYVVPIQGGIARRITTSPGMELFSRFSPDGKTIAFSGSYDGNYDIYTIASVGGEPKRLTYGVDIPNLPERMGPDKIIMQWTADGKRILYRGRQDSWNSLVGNLYFVDTTGRLPQIVELPRAGFASLSPDGKQLAFNRIFREFRMWKRYSGGQADDIWIYDFATKKTTKITDNPAQDIIPMWVGNKIFFLSDRDRTMNVFVYDLNTKETRKVTNFTEYDVKFPSLGAGNIAFTNGGEIYLLNTNTEKYQKVPVQIAEDFPLVRTQIVNVKDNIENYEISPDGKFGLFSARGDIFVVPAEKGNIINLTKSNGVHDRNPQWSPDGKYIAFISDKTGEDEIYLIRPDGTGLTQLTNDAKSYRWELLWSPDSKMILNSDKLMNLYLIDIATKQVRTIANSKVWEIRDFSFSPDCQWITYTDYAENRFPVIYLYSIKESKSYQITNEYFQNAQPTWDPKGNYLYFVSDRHFDGKMGNFEYNYIFNDMQTIFGIALRKDVINPFAKYEGESPVKIDSTAAKDQNTKFKSEKKTKTAEKTSPDNSIKIDFDDIQNRIFEFPISNGNYYGLYAFENKIYYARYKDGVEPTLYVFDLKDKKETELGKYRSYRISNDGKSILINQKGDYYITKLDSKVDLNEGKLNLDKMEMSLDRRAEWNQVFNEAWRQMKYFFYNPNMNGLDWNAIRERYGRLVPYVNHRYDLTLLIGEMIGELDAGHCYVGGGDMPKVEPKKIGLLGARYELDEQTGFYKITKIFEGRNWDNDTRSPFTEPGLNVKVGDYILAIDDEPTSAINQPNKLLVNKANEFVKLLINSKPSKDGAREIYVKTIESEDKLIYLNWVEDNRRKVEKATNGRIGYIQIPDMGFDNGLREFVKYFYPQLQKEGLIIDDRYNGGGNVSSLIIERLRREIAMVEQARNQQVVSPLPDAVMPGPLVCLVNQLSMSDGDMFPYQFKKYKLGKVIGMRTWGGIIGIRDPLPFTDGSYLMRPEFWNFGADGTMVVEDEGVKPDIEIENDPALEWSGTDEQLNKAIEVIFEEMKNNPKQQRPTTHPPYPVK
ncbi:MAG: PD40 domain-containing protein [Candidatus Kapabacteria bacterium]|nr:PD40 domain-containing protein [Candidatus Kapabacteria bacterium]